MLAVDPHPPIVLCVESEDSNFASTREVFNSGYFRVICATNGATALKVFTVLSVDAVVFDFNALIAEVGTAQRLRQIAPSVPQVLVCPSTQFRELSDPRVFTYVVHPDTLVPRLKTLLERVLVGSQRAQEAARKSVTLVTRQRQLREQLRSQMNGLKATVRKGEEPSERIPQEPSPEESSRFVRVSLEGGVQIAACAQCRAVVAISDSPAEIEAVEQTHRCHASEP